MLDINLIRSQPETVKAGIQSKNLDPHIVDKILELDAKRRQLITQAQTIRQQRNLLNDQLKNQRTPTLIEQSKQLKLQLESLTTELTQTEADYQATLLQLPNLPDPSVPVGQDCSQNVVLRTWGEKTQFNFEPKDHIHLGLDLDLLDLDRGSKVSGFRGYFLKNQAVVMQFGLMRFALDRLIQKGFVPIIPPIINHSQAFFNSGHFPWGKNEAYQLTDGQYLAGTAEVPLVSYHADEILNESDLPITYCGFSPCYRREIGNYGKDTRGLYRVHEFMKIEQVIICQNSLSESSQWHETLAKNAEDLLQELKLPYRVMLMCTGDMGEPQIKKYDLETWMPGRGDYGETMSDSIMGDFQARRANIRYRAKDGSIKYVHTLNNTALASSRMLIAIWENYQQADGSIKIPSCLVPYVGFELILPPEK